MKKPKCPTLIELQDDIGSIHNDLKALGLPPELAIQTISDTSLDNIVYDELVNLWKTLKKPPTVQQMCDDLGLTRYAIHKSLTSLIRSGKVRLLRKSVYLPKIDI